MKTKYLKVTIWISIAICILFVNATKSEEYVTENQSITKSTTVLNSSQDDFEFLMKRKNLIFDDLSKKVNSKSPNVDYSDICYDLSGCCNLIDASADVDIISLCNDFEKMNSLFANENLELKYIFLAQKKWIQSCLLLEYLLFHGVNDIEENIDAQLISNKQFSQEIINWIVEKGNLKFDSSLKNESISVTYSRVLSLIPYKTPRQKVGDKNTLKL